MGSAMHIDMLAFFSLLKCTLTACAVFGFAMTAAVTCSVSAHGVTCEAWTLFCLPLPFGAGLSLLALTLATMAANAELELR